MQGRPKLLLIGYRAYGDWLYASPALPYLFSQYEVYLETSFKGYELFYDDPRFKEISVFEVEKYQKDENAVKICKERWNSLIEKIKPDKVINLWQTLETECIAERYMPVFSDNSEVRRKEFGNRDFCSAVFNRLEVPLPKHITDAGLYFQKEHIEWAENWRKKNLNNFLVIMPVAGTCTHKYYPEIERLANHIITKYHNAKIYLVGDESLREYQFDMERVYKYCGDLSFKQTVLLAKYCDYVIGSETGVLVAAGDYGTHKTMLCTASSIEQCCSRHINDHSLQSIEECSPCHKAIYTAEDCDNVLKLNNMLVNACVFGFDFEKLTKIIEEVYNKRNIYNAEYYQRFKERGQSEIGEKIYRERWNFIDKYCHGNMNLFDFGCASGAFHKTSGNGFRCYGYDINPYSEYKDNPDSVDVMTMYDVIEHLHNPLEVISKYKPKWLFISTPNTGEVKELKTWRHYRPNEHINYFNLNSLTDLLEKANYKIVEHNYSEGAIRNSERPKDIISVAAKHDNNK